MKRFAYGVITGIVLPVWLIISLFSPTNWLSQIAPKEGETKLMYYIGLILGLCVWGFLVLNLTITPA